MKKWLWLIGLIVAGAGTLLAWQDIGSPDIARILQWLGLFMILWGLLRMRGG